METLGFTSLPSLTCLCLRECRSIHRWSVSQFYIWWLVFRRLPARSTAQNTNMCRCLQFLARLPALQALDLAYCVAADNSTLDSLTGLQNLRVLVLLHCRLVTDSGISQLVGIHTLEDVYLDGCAGVTEHGMKELQNAAPALNMIRISP